MDSEDRIPYYLSKSFVSVVPPIPVKYNLHSFGLLYKRCWLVLGAEEYVGMNIFSGV